MNWINTMIVEFNDDMAHTSLRPSLSLPCIHCRTFVADGGTASPLRGERHMVRWEPPPLPPPKVLTSPCPPHPIAPSFPADDRTPCMPTVSTISLCPFAVVFGIPVAATIVPSSFARRRGGARAQCWGGTGTWRWSAGRLRKMLTTTIVNFGCCCLHSPWPTWSPWSCRSGPSSTFLSPALLHLHAIASHPPFWLLSAPIASSHHQLLLAFTTLTSMVGCCVHAHFVVRRPFHCLLPTFIIYNHCVGLNAFVAGRHPPLPPIHHQPQLLAFAALPSMVGCCILHPISSSTHFHHRPLVQSSTLLSPTQRNK